MFPRAYNFLGEKDFFGKKIWVTPMYLTLNCQ
jgi:hypothetical protein